MPLIRVETNQPLSPAQSGDVCARLSGLAAEVLHKPEQYVQVIVSAGQVTMSHGAASGPTAFVDVRSIGGLDAAVNRRLSERICALLSGVGIPGGRVYITFQDVPATHWGHDGDTFA